MYDKTELEQNRRRLRLSFTAHVVAACESETRRPEAIA